MKTSTLFGCGVMALLMACTTETIVQRGSFGDPSATEPGTGATTDPNGSPTEDPDAPILLTDGLSIKDIALNQGVKVNLVTSGAVPTAKRNAPLVAGRRGLLRVYVTGTSSNEVTAELRLVTGGKKLPVMKDTKTIRAASTDAALASTFNFEIPGENLADDTTFHVALTSKSGVATTEASDAQFPKDGSASPMKLDVSGKLRVVVVPIQYSPAGGTVRLPDTSTAQLERYKTTMMAVYPASSVEIELHEPFAWTSTISGNGTGFSAVLNAMARLRQQERPDTDVYYYGLLAPTASMSSFCQGGCVTGLSAVVDNPNTASLRASVGVGFTGQQSANTMAHEVGHAHGREHAPCGGAQGTDPQFPYAGGAIGVWGWDNRTKTLVAPTTGKDMMGYCPNEWVSDYTYSALFTRISTIALAPSISSATVGGSSAHIYKMAIADGVGGLIEDGEITLTEEPVGGELRQATFAGGNGTTEATAHFYPYDHLPGGIVLLPSEPAYERVNVKGFATTLRAR